MQEKQMVWEWAKEWEEEMYKIAITGGKGGTGKSTVATSLAVELSKRKKILLVDLDVDCPNDDLLLSLEMKKIKNVENMIPIINI